MRSVRFQVNNNRSTAGKNCSEPSSTVYPKEKLGKKQIIEIQLFSRKFLLLDLDGTGICFTLRGIYGFVFIFGACRKWAGVQGGEGVIIVNRG